MPSAVAVQPVRRVTVAVSAPTALAVVKSVLSVMLAIVAWIVLGLALIAPVARLAAKGA